MAETSFADRVAKGILVLFDVDGTLTVPRKVITEDMKQTLSSLRSKVVIGLVGGSDLNKIEEQMAGTARTSYDLTFAENGLIAYMGTTELEKQTFINWIGEEKHKKLVNFILHYIADLDIPKKRGTFIEFRSGMLNVSPIGRNCSHAERTEFNEYDQVHHVRKTFVQVLEKEFKDYGLKFSIGGEISFDVFPMGWDKTYCLRHVKAISSFRTIHFFGDKTMAGGNDYEIFNSPDVVGHTVVSPEDTKKQLYEIFGL